MQAVNKKWIKLTTEILLFSAVLYIGYSIYNQYIFQKYIQEKTEIPQFSFKTANGDVFTNQSLDPSKDFYVFVWFSPTCGSCQELLKIITASPHNNIQYMLVAKTISKDFFEIYANKHYQFFTTSRDEFLNSFGQLSTPSIFIYNKKQKLIAKLSSIVEYADWLQKNNSPAK
ncbi:MAG: thioredoxin fold domain-containing protein [Spirosomataceae bacterium]